MPRGRPPKPVALHELHGNPGKKRLPKPNPAAPAIVDDCPPPSHLTAIGKREWRKRVAEMRQMGLFSTSDLVILAAFCSTHAAVIEAERELKKGGAVIEGRDKNPVRSPWTMIRARAVDQLLRLASELGFSPVSRARLGRASTGMPGGEQSKDDFDAYLASNPDLKPKRSARSAGPDTKH